MKLSSRKELLKESELTLKSIKRSLNEAAVPEEQIMKVSEWIEQVVDLTIQDNPGRYLNAFIIFRDYMKLPILDPRDKQTRIIELKKTINSTIPEIISRLNDYMNELKELQSQLPEIQKIVKLVDSDIKNMK